MAPPQAPATQVAEPGPQPPAQQGWAGGLAGIVRMGIFWYFAMQMFGPKKATIPAELTSNLFNKGDKLNLYVYISEESEFTGFGKSKPVWEEKNIPYAVWSPDSIRRTTYTYTVSKAAQHNASVYAHVCFATPDFDLTSQDNLKSPDDRKSRDVFCKRHSLVVYLPRPKVDTRKSLLAKDDKENSTEPLLVAPVEGVEEGLSEWVSFFKPNLTINLVDDFTRYPKVGAPPQIAERIQSHYELRFYLKDGISFRFRGQS